MTQPNPINLALPSLVTVGSSTRLQRSESSAVSACLREIELIVIGTPSVVDYINYVAHKKGELLLPELDALVNQVLEQIIEIKQLEDLARLNESTDIDTTLFYESRLKTYIKRYQDLVKSYRQLYLRYGSLVANVPTDMKWITDYKDVYTNSVGANQGSDPARSQAARVHLACVPEQLSTQQVKLSTYLSLVVQETEGRVLYESSPINPVGVVCVGDVIGGSTVVSVSQSGFVLGEPPTTPIDNTVHFRFANTTKNNVRLTLSPTNYKETARGILSSTLKVDLEAKAAQALIRGYRMHSNVNTSTYSILELNYPREVASAYDQIKRSIRKWNALHLQEQILLHNVTIQGVSALHKDKLNTTLATAAELLDTRSSI